MINLLDNNQEEIKVVKYKNIRLYVIPGGKLKKKNYRDKIIKFLKFFIPYILFCISVSFILYIYILLVIK